MSLSHEFWFWLIIILLSFNYIFNNILEYLNDNNWNTKIPIKGHSRHLMLGQEEASYHEDWPTYKNKK